MNVGSTVRCIGRESARVGAGLLLAAMLATPASAALWESEGWGLVGELRAGLTYDSNLSARADNVEDTYGVVSPRLILVRRGAATRIEAEAWVDVNRFFDFTEFDSEDPGVHLLIEHPYVDNVQPTRSLDARWERRSETNVDLGRRLRSDHTNVQGDFQMFDTGRTSLDLRLDGRRREYLEQDLNTNEAIALEGTIAYAISEPVRLGLGYGHEWARSRGDVRPDVESEQDMITARLRGELMPKLTGIIQAGVGFIDYTGAFEREETEWIGRVGLEWEPTVDIVTLIRASRMPDFEPDGETVIRTGVDVEVRRQFANGFAARLGAGYSQRDTSAGVTARDARAVSILAGLEYQLTERFSARISDRWTRQNSDRDEFDYERHFVTGDVNFRF